MATHTSWGRTKNVGQRAAIAQYMQVSEAAVVDQQTKNVAHADYLCKSSVFESKWTTGPNSLIELGSVNTEWLRKEWQDWRGYIDSNDKAKTVTSVLEYFDGLLKKNKTTADFFNFRTGLAYAELPSNHYYVLANAYTGEVCIYKTVEMGQALRTGKLLPNRFTFARDLRKGDYTMVCACFEEVDLLPYKVASYKINELIGLE